MATGGVMLAIVALTTFGMGMAAGANAAVNESQSFAEVESGLEEITPTVVKDIKANTSGLHQDVSVGIARGTSNVAVGSAGLGAMIGYNSPLVAKIVVPAIPLVLIGGLGYYIYRFVGAMRG